MIFQYRLECLGKTWNRAARIGRGRTNGLAPSPAASGTPCRNRLAGNTVPLQEKRADQAQGLARKGRRLGLAQRGGKEHAGLAQEKFEEPIIYEAS
jgi:hypothetical protein